MRDRLERALLCTPLLLIALLPVAGEGQEVLSRTPNLSGGWVGERGVIHTSFNHRFWFIDLPDEKKLANSPSFFVGLPLPGRLMVQGTYASNSRVAAGKFNEWEALVRWRPASGLGPFGAGLSAGYNFAAESFDGEFSLSTALPLPDGFPGDSLTILGAARLFSDAFGGGVGGWFGGGGAILHFGSGFALSGDFGQATLEGEDLRSAWGAGLQFRIPASPHTVALYATNAQTGTLQGSSGGGRTVWGFEFTVPFTLARYLSGGGNGGPAAATPVGTNEITMTNTLRFLPETVQVRVGETVVWRNTTSIVHTVTADPARFRGTAIPSGAASFDSGNMSAGAVFRHTFTVPGEYIYLCAPHEQMGMMGRVVVVP